jgi:PAS domain S-box-containing protein
MNGPTVAYGNAVPQARALADRLAARLGASKGSSRLRHALWTLELLKLGLFAAAFWVAYGYAMSFSQASAAPFWFPDSVLLCALLLSRPDRWWMFVLAALPVRLVSSGSFGPPLWFLLSTFAIDSAKGVLAAAALRRYVGAPTRLASVRQFLLYVLIAAFAVPAFTAFAGAAVRSILGHPFWPAWQQWFAGNAVTNIVLTPALYYCCLGFRWRPVMPNAKRLTEGVLLAGGLIVTAYVVFAWPNAPSSAGYLYAPLPYLLWAGLRFGMVGMSATLLLLAGFAIRAALLSHGPFANQSADEAARALQEYLLLRAAPFYLIAILVEQDTAVRSTLRESDARFTTLADASPIMIWMSAPDRRRKYLNQHWLDFTGHVLDAHDGNGWIEAVHPDDQERVLRRYRDACEARKAFSIEYRLRQRDGQFRRVLDRGAPCTAPDGALLGYMGSCTDVVERKLLLDHRIDLAAHADRVASMGQLASALAHELNQPLGAILRNAEAAELILQKEPLDYDEVRAILADIRKDDQRAGAVIDRMRAMLKRRDVQFEALSVRQLLDQVSVLLRNELLARRVTMQVDVSPDIPLIRGDRVHLQQVLINLLFNGADALNGSRIEQRRLYIRARLTGHETVEISVHDTGHGIAEDHLTRLFEPFFTTKPNGMGMGMAIAKAIVESHGGEIRAENNPEGGATFTFTLRVAEQGGTV